MIYHICKDQGIFYLFDLDFFNFLQPAFHSAP